MSNRAIAKTHLFGILLMMHAVASPIATSQSLQWVTVGNTGNSAVPVTGFGAAADEHGVMTYENTIHQYSDGREFGFPLSGSTSAAIGAPTELQAIAGQGSVELTWVAPSVDGGSAITEYEVEQTTDGRSWSASTVAPSLGASNPTSARVTGLTDGSEYQFRVRAVIGLENGAWSSTATATPIAAAATGASWSTQSSAADNDWFSVTYGNGQFVAVSATGSGNDVMTSPDGITWTGRSAAANNRWRSVTFANGLFVAVSEDGPGNRVMTSPDGITWTSRASAANNQWFSVTYGNGLFVAVSATGTRRKAIRGLGSQKNHVKGATR